MEGESVKDYFYASQIGSLFYLVLHENPVSSFQHHYFPHFCSLFIIPAPPVSSFLRKQESPLTALGSGSSPGCGLVFYGNCGKRNFHGGFSVIKIGTPAFNSLTYHYHTT
jgi:hypothetical protein